VTGAVLIYCRRSKTGPVLAKPIGFGWFKCTYCGATFRGIEDA
jgi:hypothetical protein